MIFEQSHGVFIGNCFIISTLNTDTLNKALAAQKEPKDIAIHVTSQGLFPIFK